MIKNSIISDFNVNIYKEINTDLRHLHDSRATLHFYKSGIKEGRRYKLNIPDDFDPKIYKELNPDINIMTNIEAMIHFYKWGIKERRIYKLNLPCDFDVNMYKVLNPDLQNMTDIEAKKHFHNWGVIENRAYVDKYFDREYFATQNNYDINDPELYIKYVKNIKQNKNVIIEQYIKYIDSLHVDRNKKHIILVNHDYSLYGATHYLYILYKYLVSVYADMKVLLFEIKYNSELLNKYNISKNEIIEYYGDSTFLYKLYEFFNPALIYLNSSNNAMFQVHTHIDKNKLILHSHEIFDHYLLSKNVVPDFVVSSRIANQYNNFYNNMHNAPAIQPPFLDNIPEILQQSDEPITNDIINKYGKMDTAKITIGMCGQITKRKNYDLFIEISKIFQEYNFLWIGDFKTNIFDEYRNIYHIPFTNNPYKYYKKIIDYFILFSVSDPCPYVILENILLETPTITFSNNIYTKHTDLDFYYEYEGAISFKTCTEAINKFVKEKKKLNKINLGYKYIEQNFSKPTAIINVINQKLAIK